MKPRGKLLVIIGTQILKSHFARFLTFQSVGGKMQLVVFPTPPIYERALHYITIQRVRLACHSDMSSMKLTGKIDQHLT
jgi:hypothetical protein